jgi:hypothetical protein
MYECKLCGRFIEAKNLRNIFEFTLGNIKYGKFHGAKSYYYHIKCLNKLDSKEEKLQAPTT